MSIWCFNFLYWGFPLLHQFCYFTRWLLSLLCLISASRVTNYFLNFDMIMTDDKSWRLIISHDDGKSVHSSTDCPTEMIQALSHAIVWLYSCFVYTTNVLGRLVVINCFLLHNQDKRTSTLLLLLLSCYLSCSLLWLDGSKDPACKYWFVFLTASILNCCSN